MRHKYTTRALVLARSPIGEANTLLTLCTADVGLVRARAQGLRKSGAKLAASLATFAESDVVLVRGVEGWRVAGAHLAADWFVRLSQDAQARAARVCGLFLRLVAGESIDPALFAILQNFFAGLATTPEGDADLLECLAALSILRTLGLDAGDAPPALGDPAPLATLAGRRSEFIARINNGIAASGL